MSHVPLLSVFVNFVVKRTTAYHQRVYFRCIILIVPLPNSSRYFGCFRQFSQFSKKSENDPTMCSALNKDIHAIEGTSAII